MRILVLLSLFCLSAFSAQAASGTHQTYTSTMTATMNTQAPQPANYVSMASGNSSPRHGGHSGSGSGYTPNGYSTSGAGSYNGYNNGNNASYYNGNSGNYNGYNSGGYSASTNANNGGWGGASWGGSQRYLGNTVSAPSGYNRNSNYSSYANGYGSGSYAPSGSYNNQPAYTPPSYTPTPSTPPSQYTPPPAAPKAESAPVATDVAPARDQAAPAPRTASQVYVLNDGREIRVINVVESGDDVILKSEKGKIISLKKADIKSIRDLDEESFPTK